MKNFKEKAAAEAAGFQSQVRSANEEAAEFFKQNPKAAVYEKGGVKIYRPMDYTKQNNS